MTQKEFQAMVADCLSQDKRIKSVLCADRSLLIGCSDQSSFLMNVLKSQWTFEHCNLEHLSMDECAAAYGKEGFANDLLDMADSHSSFFFLFMLFNKLEEMGIIDEGLFYHLSDSIAHCEDEMGVFLSKLSFCLKRNDS